jgi:glycosyltransferase involved in cell wall biosynthesis
MKLGINLTSLFPGKIGGGEQYIRNVISAMQRKENIRLFLFLNSEGFETFQETNNTSKFVILMDSDTVSVDVAIDIQLNYYIDYLNLDVWFCPLFHLIPKDCSIPSVVTIFDIQQEYFPENFTKKVLRARRRLTEITVKKANLLLTISEFSKKTIIENFAFDSGRIKVTWLDSDETFYAKPDEDLKKSNALKYHLPEEYLLFPANTWPHKNHLRLLEAYYKLKKEKRLNAKLLLTGAEQDTHSKLERFIKKHGLSDDVFYLGYVDQNEMPYIFANASMLIFPSLFEGFGIPLVEAMRIGIPIACSNTGSLPEVGGDAVLYFDPYSADDIAEKIYSLYSDQELQNKLVTAGFERTALFSWDNCTEQTLTYIRLLCEEKTSISEKESELPLVSVITPSYNQGAFIRETIDSVLHQSYPNIEYIVMDGGSADETVQILEGYGDRIIWVSEKDDGQADAVNKGLRLAKGEIIGWLNSDDTYTSDAVRKAVDFLTAHPKTHMVYGEGHYINKEGKITGRYDTEKFSEDRLAETCIICQPTAFIRKSTMEQVGGLDARLQLCMDYELWIRIARVGRISYIPEYLASSRMYEENKTNARRREVFREVCTTIKKHYGYLPANWAYGYADYLMQGSRGKRFMLITLWKFFRYNFTNPKYFLYTIAKYYYRIQKSKNAPPYEGKYDDSWLSAKYVTEVIFENSGQALEIRGCHVWPIDSPLVIKVRLDDCAIDKIVIEERGDFIRVLPFKRTIEAGRHFLNMEMNMTFVPSRFGLNNDKRKLSFMLEGVKVIS